VNLYASYLGSFTSEVIFWTYRHRHTMIALPGPLELSVIIQTQIIQPDRGQNPGQYQ